MIRRQKSSRQFGVCGSALERAPVPHKTSRIRRSRSRRLKRPLAPARRSAAVCGGLGSRAKKEPKKAYRDFQAIRRKGVVQGQSRQALMSWRKRHTSPGACWRGAPSEPERCMLMPRSTSCTTLAVRHASPRPSRYAPCAQLSHDRRRAGAARFDDYGASWPRGRSCSTLIRLQHGTLSRCGIIIQSIEGKVISWQKNNQNGSSAVSRHTPGAAPGAHDPAQRTRIPVPDPRAAERAAGAPHHCGTRGPQAACQLAMRGA